MVKESEQTSKEYSEQINSSRESNIFIYISPKDVVLSNNYMKDITKKVFNEIKKMKINPSSKNIIKKVTFDKKNVFIVHGHDNLAKEEVARFVEKLNLVAIILHEQPNSGKTIIEKIEAYSNIGFAIILYTPCDVGSPIEDKDNLKLRARQNVVFEHGYLMAKIGRSSVCALVKDELEIPNDISGVVYIPMDDHKAWQLAIAKEMRHAGYNIDMNLII